MQGDIVNKWMFCYSDNVEKELKYNHYIFISSTDSHAPRPKKQRCSKETGIQSLEILGTQSWWRHCKVSFVRLIWGTLVELWVNFETTLRQHRAIFYLFSTLPPTIPECCFVPPSTCQNNEQTYRSRRKILENFCKYFAQFSIVSL